MKVVTKNEGRISPQGLSSLVVPKSDALRIRNEGGIFWGGSILPPVVSSMKASVMSGEFCSHKHFRMTENRRVVQNISTDTASYYTSPCFVSTRRKQANASADIKLNRSHLNIFVVLGPG